MNKTSIEWTDYTAGLKSGIRHGMKGLGPITPPAIVAHIDAIYAQIEEAVRK